MDKNSLAHTKWNCKYHIVFTPKYRRQAIYGKIKKDIKKLEDTKIEKDLNIEEKYVFDNFTETTKLDILKKYVYKKKND